MCAKSLTLDRSIAQYRLSHDSANDPLAIALLAGVIADLEAEKAELHRGDKQTGESGPSPGPPETDQGRSSFTT
jgi:hypothetical protein